jgi:hypothetical protein
MPYLCDRADSGPFSLGTPPWSTVIAADPSGPGARTWPPTTRSPTTRSAGSMRDPLPPDSEPWSGSAAVRVNQVGQAVGWPGAQECLAVAAVGAGAGKQSHDPEGGKQPAQLSCLLTLAWTQVKRSRKAPASMPACAHTDMCSTKSASSPARSPRPDISKSTRRTSHPSHRRLARLGSRGANTGCRLARADFSAYPPSIADR